MAAGMGRAVPMVCFCRPVAWGRRERIYRHYWSGCHVNEAGLECEPEFGTGVAFLSNQHYDEQDFGGHVQIIGQGGIFYHFPGNIVGGWRFQHFSDADFMALITVGLIYIFLNSVTDSEPVSRQTNLDR